MYQLNGLTQDFPNFRYSVSKAPKIFLSLEDHYIPTRIHMTHLHNSMKIPSRDIY